MFEAALANALAEDDPGVWKAIFERWLEVSTHPDAKPSESQLGPVYVE
jgi:hypothetical protein